MRWALALPGWGLGLESALARHIPRAVKDAKKRDLATADRVIHEIAGKLLDRPALDFEGAHPARRKETARVGKAANLLDGLIESQQKSFRTLERNFAIEVFANLKVVSPGSGPIVHLQRSHRLPEDFAEREAALARA